LPNCDDHSLNSEKTECCYENLDQGQLTEAPVFNIKLPTKSVRSKLFFCLAGLAALAFIVGIMIFLSSFDIYSRDSAPAMPIISTTIDSEYFSAGYDIEITPENTSRASVVIELKQVFTEFSDGALENLTLNNNKLKLETAMIDFEKSIIADNFLSARSVHAVDIDQDGKIDVLGAARQIHQIAWWKNDGINLDTGKINFTEFIIDNEFQGAFSVHGVDIDNDGYKDVVGASLYDEQIAWWRNNQDGTFSERRIIDSYFDGAIFIYSADIDNDGYMDILAAGEAVDQIAWWKNQGDGMFSPSVVIGDNFTGARSVHAADVDEDGDIDVLGTARFADKVAWWENKGEGKEFFEHIIDNNFSGPRSVHATDLDNDGDIDVLGAARYSHQIALWDNDGEQNFTKIIIDDKFEGATNVYSADIDHDGKKDIIAAAVYANKVAWWKNHGDGQFTRFTIEENFKGATFVYAEDINGDGYKDILVPAVFDNQIGLWLNKPQYVPTGSFVSPVINKIQNLKFANISWEGQIPENTFLRFQVRSANSVEALESAIWYGPFSTDDYYTVSGTVINPVHTEHLLFQYRVFFETDDLLISPSLNKFIISYNVFGEIR